MTMIKIHLLREVGDSWDVLDIEIDDPLTLNWIELARDKVAEEYPGWKIISINTFTEMEVLERYEELDPVDMTLYFE